VMSLRVIPMSAGIAVLRRYAGSEKSDSIPIRMVLKRGGFER